ncbi:MAG: YggS family pyridoxal phosphate-dependent enzyme [Lachnospiraceae bacterium]|nr:YggS family pyridoxal phosphate-dependent enzyme [Lachnospiraceae bacterium]MBR6469168.1 YggS family pyridoxal phosphate-dependent enzyme [Lachnospiraceae bacterium]
MLKDNLMSVQDNIKQAAMRSGRELSDITLIAVSKTKPVEMIKEIYDLGVRDFGENKVQELVAKYDQLPGDIKWHLIGHLQTNKVKYIVDKVYMIHSVDSLKLAREISREAVKRGITVNILIEVNVAGEESKYGISPDELEETVRQVAELPGIIIRGLMTVAPYVVDSEENRPIFVKMKQFVVDIIQKNIDNVCMDCLSMGMSGDYTVAVEEGATYIRVGTSIFGERNYK